MSMLLYAKRQPGYIERGNPQCYVLYFVTLQDVGSHQSSNATIRTALSWHSFSASCVEKHVASALLLSRMLPDVFQSQP